MVTFYRISRASRPLVRAGAQIGRVLLGTLALLRMVLVMTLMMLALSIIGLIGQARRRR